MTEPQLSPEEMAKEAQSAVHPTSRFWWRGVTARQLRGAAVDVSATDRRTSQQAGKRETADQALSVEVEEVDDAYLVRAEVPGRKLEDVKVELDSNELSLSSPSGKYRLELPPNVDSEKINAELDDGILTVSLPKVAQARSRRIDPKIR